MNEFELIRAFFTRAEGRDEGVVVGIGDDAAVCTVPADQELVLTTDLLVAGVHFPEHAPAESVGHKALAVNLSDLASMGARPLWFTMNLSLPAVDRTWLEQFSDGLFALADRYRIALVGGDTVRGPLSVGIQACGLVPSGSAVLRSGAQAGDDVYVTGSLGDAALGLRVETGEADYGDEGNRHFLKRLHQPTPRIRIGESLRGMATSMIDVSDGLVADLGRTLHASGVGAEIELELVPLSDRYRQVWRDAGWQPALAGGDDYELCFTAPRTRRAELSEMSRNWECQLSRIGRITESTDFNVLDRAGKPVSIEYPGYDHFPD